MVFLLTERGDILQKHGRGGQSRPRPGSVDLFLSLRAGAALGPDGSGFLHEVSQDPKGRARVPKESSLPLRQFLRLGVTQTHPGFVLTLLFQIQ